jgi:hypothetical protein
MIILTPNEKRVFGALLEIEATKIGTDPFSVFVWDLFNFAVNLDSTEFEIAFEGLVEKGLIIRGGYNDLRCSSFIPGRNSCE